MDANKARELVELHKSIWIYRFDSWSEPFCDMVVHTEYRGNEVTTYTYNYLMGIIKAEELLHELKIPTSD